tara:strand:+ start:4335 stop:6293 length:1959 start_codon:yes stop_codon:yes gene_type:complete
MGQGPNDDSRKDVTGETQTQDPRKDVTGGTQNPPKDTTFVDNVLRFFGFGKNSLRENVPGETQTQDPRKDVTGGTQNPPREVTEETQTQDPPKDMIEQGKPDEKVILETEGLNCWDTSGCGGIIIDSSQSTRTGASTIWSNLPIGKDMDKARFEAHVATSGPLTTITNEVGTTGTLVQSNDEQEGSFSSTGYGHLLDGAGKIPAMTIFDGSTSLFDFERYRAGALVTAPFGGADGNVMQLCEFMENVKNEITMYGIVYVEVDVERDNGASTAHIGEVNCQPPLGYTASVDTSMPGSNGFPQQQTLNQAQGDKTQSMSGGEHSEQGGGDDTVAGGGFGGGGPSNIPSVDMGDGEKVRICHRTNDGKSHVIDISSSALSAHYTHGDYLYEGALGSQCPPTQTTEETNFGETTTSQSTSDNPCENGHAKLENGKVDIRGTLVFDFVTSCPGDTSGFRVEFNVPTLINPASGPATNSIALTSADWEAMRDENIDNTTPSENNWPSGYLAGWEDVLADAPAYSPVGKLLSGGHLSFGSPEDVNGSPIVSSSNAEDLAALMYTDGLVDFHHGVNISGVVYTPHFAEIEQLCPAAHNNCPDSPQVQYINGALVAQYGVWIEDRVNAGGIAINFDPSVLNSLAAKATPRNVGVRGIVEIK